MSDLSLLSLSTTGAFEMNYYLLFSVEREIGTSVPSHTSIIIISWRCLFSFYGLSLSLTQSLVPLYTTSYQSSPSLSLYLSQGTPTISLISHCRRLLIESSSREWKGREEKKLARKEKEAERRERETFRTLDTHEIERGRQGRIE